jgi:hypothetical protein
MARHEDYTIAVGADESHLLRLQLTFVCTDRVPWSLRFLTV